jgi:photosystem II stability/assembly factor-like uncharacterized protein
MRTTMTALLLAAVATSLHAGSNQWTHISPETDVPVYAFDLDPSAPDNLYVAMLGKVARSKDGGLSWTTLPISTAMKDDGIFWRIQIDPQRSGHIMVLGWRGFYQSYDDGETWVGGKFDQQIGGFTTEFATSRDTATIYVAAPPFCFGSCSGGGVFTSTNGGRNWSRTGLKDDTVTGLTVDPFDANVTFAFQATENRAPGLLRTLDGGRTWTAISSPATSGKLVADPITPNKLYLATTVGGLWVTRDRGDNWETIKQSWPVQVAALAFDPIDPATVATLTAPHRDVTPLPNPPQLPGAPPLPPQPPTLPPPPTDLYGLMRSDDGGRAFTRVLPDTPPYPGTDFADSVRELFLDPRRTAFYVRTSNGVFGYSIFERRRSVRR